MVNLIDLARDAASLKKTPAEEKGSLSRLSNLVLGDFYTNNSINLGFMFLVCFGEGGKGIEDVNHQAYCLGADMIDHWGCVCEVCPT